MLIQKQGVTSVAAGSGANSNTAVPEPASVVQLLLMAVVAIGMRSRLDRIADGHRVRCLGFAVRRYPNQKWLLPFLVLALLGTSVCHAKLLLYVGGIEGDSTLAGYQGWSDVDDFAISVKQGVPSPLYVSAPTSSISPHMFFFSLGQQVIKEELTLEIVFVNPSPSPTSVAAWSLKDARVTEFSIAGDSDGNSTDQYTIDYRAIQYRYSTETGDIVVQWDRTTGQPTIIDNSNGGSIAIFTGNSELLPPATGIPGDYNQNGIVDAADYTVWRDNLGSTTILPNDPSPGMVTQEDYGTWKVHFGQMAGSGSAASANAAVPEPTSGLLLILAAAGVCLRRRRNAERISKLINA